MISLKIFFFQFSEDMYCFTDIQNSDAIGKDDLFSANKVFFTTSTDITEQN